MWNDQVEKCQNDGGLVLNSRLINLQVFNIILIPATYKTCGNESSPSYKSSHFSYKPFRHAVVTEIVKKVSEVRKSWSQGHVYVPALKQEFISEQINKNKLATNAVLSPELSELLSSYIFSNACAVYTEQVRKRCTGIGRSQWWRQRRTKTNALYVRWMIKIPDAQKIFLYFLPVIRRKLKKISTGLIPKCLN